MRLLATMLACAAAGVAGGCSYRAGTALPAGLRTVYVPVLQNKTRATGLEADVTKALVAEFQAEGSLRPVKMKDADCEVRGAVSSYKRDVTGKGTEGVPTERQVVIRASVSLVDRRDGKTLIDGMIVSSVHTDPRSGAFRIEAGESERLGRERATRALARAIVRAVVEYW